MRPITFHLRRIAIGVIALGLFNVWFWTSEIKRKIEQKYNIDWRRVFDWKKP